MCFAQRVLADAVRRYVPFTNVPKLSGAYFEATLSQNNRQAMTLFTVLLYTRW